MILIFFATKLQLNSKNIKRIATRYKKRGSERMKIECTPQELKELIENKKTPVAGTTDVKRRAVEPIKNAYFINDIIGRPREH